MCVVTSVLILEGWQWRLDPALHIHHGIQSVMTSEWKNTCNVLRNATVAAMSAYLGAGGSDVSEEHKSNPFAHQEARWRKQLKESGEGYKTVGKMKARDE